MKVVYESKQLLKKDSLLGGSLCSCPCSDNIIFKAVSAAAVAAVIQG